MNSATLETPALLKGALDPIVVNVQAFLGEMGSHSARSAERLKELSMELGGLLWAMARLPKTESALSSQCQMDWRREPHLAA